MEKFFDFLKNPITISILVLVIGIGGIWALISNIPKGSAVKGDKVERTWGKQDSTVVIEVWSDYQCPGCKFYWDNVEGQLREKYEDRVKFVYQHYPLGIHVKADDAAEAAEAAGEQGKFFEYSDVLFANQPSQTDLASWTDSKFIEYARQVEGLDVAKFEEAYKSNKYEEVIDDYVRDGEKKKVDSTPTVFINGEEIRGQDQQTGQATIPDFATMEAKILELLGDTGS